jgi:hypothetical protein
MIRFEGLYICRSLRTDGSGVTLVECFSKSGGHVPQLVLFAKLLGLRRGVKATFSANVTRIDQAGSELILEDYFKVVPPLDRTGPVEVAAFFMLDRELVQGDYLATLTLESGEQESATFEIE